MEAERCHKSEAGANFMGQLYGQARVNLAVQGMVDMVAVYGQARVNLGAYSPNLYLVVMQREPILNPSKEGNC